MQVVVTGASRGIGHALVDRYRREGHHVIGTARGHAGDIDLDVTKPQDFRRLPEALGGAPVDLLVCNAGIYPDKGQSLETGYRPEMWAETFAVNVTGVFLTVQNLLQNLRAAEAGKIAIISSQMASHTKAPGGSYIYRSSKAAALNLGRNLAADLAGEGIAVGIYHPGWVRTDMGGSSADISVEQAATGLMDRFRELDVKTTGCFRTWDGRDHPF
jgi:NAD(P)-dependent dehydrogenase (short-subunit alcohol dehydrogenase family)